ncbi:MAG: elongation factor 1-beta [Thermoproteota archaeon]
MAKVLVVVSVYPSDVNIDLEKLVEEVRAKLPEGYDVTRHTKVPIAFGLNALKLYIIMPEEVEGGTSTLEEILRSLEGVEEVEVEAVHRLSEF